MSLLGDYYSFSQPIKATFRKWNAEEDEVIGLEQTWIVGYYVQFDQHGHQIAYVDLWGEYFDVAPIALYDWVSENKSHVRNFKRIGGK